MCPNQVQYYGVQVQMLNRHLTGPGTLNPVVTILTDFLLNSMLPPFITYDKGS